MGRALWHFPLVTVLSDAVTAAPCQVYLNTSEIDMTSIVVTVFHVHPHHDVDGGPSDIDRGATQAMTDLNLSQISSAPGLHWCFSFMLDSLLVTGWKLWSRAIIELHPERNLQCLFAQTTEERRCRTQ